MSDLRAVESDITVEPPTFVAIGQLLLDVNQILLFRAHANALACSMLGDHKCLTLFKLLFIYSIYCSLELSVNSSSQFLA